MGKGGAIMVQGGTLLLSVLILALPFGFLAAPAESRDEEVWEVELAALIEKLADFDAATWPETRAGLRALGTRAVPALTRSLSSSRVHVRRRAAEALQAIGPDAEAAGPELAENLHDDSAVVRCAAALALGHVDPERAVERLSRLIDAPRTQLDKMAIWQGLAAAGDRSAPVMRREMMQGPIYRRQMLAAIMELGPGVAPLLRALVQDESWHVRMWSIDATVALEEIPATLAEVIAAAGADQREAVAVAATQRMALAVPGDPWFTPHLARLVLDPRAEVRRAATYGLARISAWDSSLVVPLLAHAQDEKDEGVRINVARGLALFPEDLRAQARAALGPMLRDQSPLVRIAASWSLVELGDLSAAPAPGLIAAVATYGGIPAPFRYYLRSRALGVGGRKRFDGFVMPLHEAPHALALLDPEAIPVLETAATRLKGPRRVMLVYALWRMGEVAIPALERLLANADPLVSKVAACCLACFGAKGKAAVPLLVTLASRHDPYDPVIVEAGEDALGEIVEELTEEEGWTSWIRESRDALVAIGAPALPALRKAAGADPQVAKRLAPLIAAIGEQAPR